MCQPSSSRIGSAIAPFASPTTWPRISAPQVRFGHPADLAIPLGGRRVVGNAAGQRGEIRARLLQLLHHVVELLARGILGRLVGVLCQGDDDLSQLETPGHQKRAGIGVVDTLDIGLARVVLGRHRDRVEIALNDHVFPRARQLGAIAGC